MLRHATGYVGMMMLNADQTNLRLALPLLLSPLRCEIAGMEIVGNDGGSDFEDVLKRRLCGSRISAMHSSQVAMSGEMSVPAPPEWVLSRMD